MDCPDCVDGRPEECDAETEIAPTEWDLEIGADVDELWRGNDEAKRLHEAFSKFIAIALCVKKKNTPEFMAYLAEQCNVALAALGTEDRVEWPGKWANEFSLVIGGKP